MAGRMLRNISWLTLGNVLVKPIWLAFITLACIRVLGEEGYGVFTATLFLSAIVVSLADLGVAQHSTREVARRRRYATRYFSNFFLLRLAVNGVAVGVTIWVGWTLGYTGSKLMALLFASGYTAVLSLTDYCRVYFRAFERMEYEAFSTIAEKVFVVAVGVLFLFAFRTAEGVLAGMAVGMLLALLLNLRWIFRRFARLRLRLLSRRFVLSVLPVAFPLGLASLFVMIYFRTDAVMVDKMVGEGAAGQYGAAYRLLEASMLIVAMINTVAFPRLSSLFQERQGAGFTRVFRLSVAGVVGLGLAIAAGFAIFAHPIMYLLKGDDSFGPAAEALQLLGWAAPFICLNGLLSITLSASDQQWPLAIILGIAAVLNVGLNFALIPSYSFYGACVSTFITEAVITVMLGVRYVRHIHQNPRSLRLNPPPAWIAPPSSSATTHSN